MLKRPVSLLARHAFLWQRNNCLKVCHNSFAFVSLRRFASKPDLEMDHLEKNPHFAKYAEKLKRMQETSPEVFQQKLDELVSTKKPKEVASSSSKEDEKLSSETPLEVNYEALDSILRVDQVMQKSPDEITEIWKAYHSEKDCVFAVIPALEYEEMHSRSKEFPNFLYPVPRGDGYEFFVQRWKDHVCVFTPLLSYQTHKENAAPCLSFVHYTEFQADKGIVLMRGDPSTNVLSVYESQLLALQVKLYYGIHSGLKFNYVRLFNNTPESFRYSDLIREFDNYKKDLKEKI